jgi:hypothetical protein
MHSMVIERARAGARPVYERFGEQGRLMPDGLDFVASWVSADLGRVFQVMECDDITRLQQWVANWEDLVEFEIVPVAGGGSAVAEAVLGS